MTTGYSRLWLHLLNHWWYVCRDTYFIHTYTCNFTVNQVNFLTLFDCSKDNSFDSLSRLSTVDVIFWYVTILYTQHTIHAYLCTYIHTCITGSRSSAVLFVASFSLVVLTMLNTYVCTYLHMHHTLNYILYCVASVKM